MDTFGSLCMAYVKICDGSHLVCRVSGTDCAVQCQEGFISLLLKMNLELETDFFEISLQPYLCCVKGPAVPWSSLVKVYAMSWILLLSP